MPRLCLVLHGEKVATYLVYMLRCIYDATKMPIMQDFLDHVVLISRLV